MSLRATQWAWTVECSSTAKLVLLALADAHHDKTGDAFPSHATIVRRTGLSESAVKRAIRALDKARLLTRAERVCPRTGRTWGVFYNLAIEEASQAASREASQAGTSRPLEPAMGAPEPSGRGPVGTTSYRNGELQRGNNPSPGGSQARPQPPEREPAQKPPKGTPIAPGWHPKVNHLDWLTLDISAYLDGWEPAERPTVVRSMLIEWADEFRAYHLSLAHSRRQGWRADWDAAFQAWLMRRAARWRHEEDRLS